MTTKDPSRLKPLSESVEDLPMEETESAKPLRPSEQDTQETRHQAQQDHDDSVLDAFLDEDSGEPSNDGVGKVEIRPMTLTTLDLLRKTKSPFATGQMPDEEDFLMSLGIFFFIHSPTIPLPEIVKTCLGPREGLEVKAYEVMDEIPVGDMEATFAGVTSYVAEQTSTMAIPEEDKDLKGSGKPEGNG